MQYIKVSQAAEKWGISSRRVRLLCAENKVEGVIRKGNLYLIPADAEKPRDGRQKDSQKSNVEDDYISDSANAINNMRTIVSSPEFQQVFTTMQKLGATVAKTLQSEAMQSVLNMGQEIAKVLAKVDFTPIVNQLAEVMIPIRYIQILKEIRWPIFLIQDDNLRTDIMNACECGVDEESVAEVIYNYCSDEYLLALEMDWVKCPILNSERKKILTEALALHKAEYYYASTSMLMCQVYGVAADINKVVSMNNFSIDQEDKKYIAELYDIGKIDSEKGRLFQTLMYTENGVLLWESMAEYLNDICLTSKRDFADSSDHPMRNKICHGEQVNFGTKEHSLKSILVIDMLVQLGDEIERIARAKAEAIDN